MDESATLAGQKDGQGVADVAKAPAPEADGQSRPESTGSAAPSKVAERQNPSTDDVSKTTASKSADRVAAAHGTSGGTDAGKAVEAIASRSGREAPVATGTAAVAAFAGSSVLVSSQTEQPQAADEKSDQPSMFASLYAQSKAKTPIRNTDLGKTRRVILPRSGAPLPATDGASLPGVRSNASLFEIGQKASADYDADIIDEANGEEGLYQTASISGLARLAPNGLTVQRPDVQTSCFQPDLVSIIRAVETKFRTKVMVTSGYRSPTHNTRVNGAKRSMHLQCKAADIIVPGADKFQVASFVRGLPNRGGVGTYCNTVAIHVDTGRQRDWNWACRRSPARDSRILLASQKLMSTDSGD